MCVGLIGVTTLTNTQAAAKEDKSWRIDSAEAWNGASLELSL